MLFRSIITLAALAAATSSMTAKDCSAGTSKFTVGPVSVDPINPVAGDPFNLHLTYTVPDGLTVTDGTAEYDITLNFIPFQPSKEPLCQDVPCPLGPGTYSNTTTSTWPSGITGSLVNKMKWLDTDGSLLLCIQVSGNVGAASPAGSPVANNTKALVPIPLKSLVVRTVDAVRGFLRGAKRSEGPRDEL